MKRFHHTLKNLLSVLVLVASLSSVCTRVQAQVVSKVTKASPNVIQVLLNDHFTDHSETPADLPSEENDQERAENPLEENGDDFASFSASTLVIHLVATSTLLENHIFLSVPSAPLCRPPRA